MADDRGVAIFKENNEAVVVIIASCGEDQGGQGSGFIVRQDGIIVTCYHVVEGARFIEIQIPNDISCFGKVVRRDKRNDIAILEVDATNLPTVKLGDSEKMKIGEKVYVISSPKGWENSMVDGVVSGKRKLDSWGEVFQTTAAISGGSSGGPMFNKSGEVIGIIRSSADKSGAQHLNFATPVNVIKKKIASIPAPPIEEVENQDYSEIAEAWFDLGKAYSMYDMFDEAIKAYKRAIKIKPDYARVYIRLGDAYAETGMYNAAIREYRKVTSIETNAAYAYYKLGLLYEELSKHQRAIKAFNQSVKIKPNQPKAYHKLGVAYGKAEMYREAVEVFKEVIRMQPKHAEAHHDMGVIYMRLNDKNAALSEYEVLKNLDEELAKELFDVIYS